ncbi:MAG: hypothetical protein M1484_04245 [Patescibacteria group bacterium]|nr:hypothetical protein [Patescibacteria group bacterium]MCL5432270.1 hypothetical protein [Patescibacteria group bacterium]
MDKNETRGARYRDVTGRWRNARDQGREATDVAIGQGLDHDSSLAIGLHVATTAGGVDAAKELTQMYYQAQTSKGIIRVVLAEPKVAHKKNEGPGLLRRLFIVAFARNKPY